MIDYSLKPTKNFTVEGRTISSFLSADEHNIDWVTVNAFGEEWKKFKNFEEEEIQQIGNDYFDLVDTQIVNKNTRALDVGCGSGRWARYLAPHVNFIEAIDPSQSVLSASVYLTDKSNVRVTQASVDNIPFPDKSFDLVYSLGVLHHLPDTALAIKKCTEKIKPGGWLLLYLYYALENRSVFYRLIFHISTAFRKVISILPAALKKFVCDIIALCIYLPAATLVRILYRFEGLRNFADRIPLAYYRKTSLHVMRNDALDRFGTPLEKRFTKEEIRDMLSRNGFSDIRFSNNKPYWHVIAQRPN